ncbi:hypothetical protein PUN28_016857 [Cardiocondyla obscurior]|uniref:Uncharacterized protein n=2 Tax=Cardiocondyla obscurior TaxID=286306 RepID=A0AAW2EUC7_9HYME
MDINNCERQDDPQFVKILETCLKMEIEAMKGKLDAMMEEMRQLKTTIRSELNKRKELKGKITQMNKIRLILSETLTKLYISINEISDTLGTMKVNADDQYKLIQLRSEEYQDVVVKYKTTWHEYRTVYEEFPLAKARKAAKISLGKLKMEYMIASYKKSEMMKIIKQRQRIKWIRMRCKIVNFITTMFKHLKLEEKLGKLKVNVKYQKRELQSIETELQVLRRKEEDQKRQRKEKMLEMAPPKINIPYREMYAQNKIRTKVQPQWKQIHENLDDSISVNTLYLEELCINESSTTLPERIDIEEMHEKNYKLAAIEAKTSNSKSTVVSEKGDRHATSVASAIDMEPSAEEAILIDNNVEMKEIHEDEKSQESVKTQSSCRTKESSLKHRTGKNTLDEIEPKRMRLQRHDSKRNIDRITTPQPSAVVTEMDLQFSPRSVPTITKIESVNYNIVPLAPPKPKPIQCSTAAGSNMFSPSPEYCDSNMTSFDQDFVSKGGASLYEGSMCNFKLSPTSEILFSADEEVQTASSKYVTPQNNKTNSDKTSSEFQFGNFLKDTKSNFSLF